MPNQDSNSDSRQLNAIERSSEVLFGLIMVLTFTGSFRITGGDHDSVDRMLLLRWDAISPGASSTRSCT